MSVVARAESLVEDWVGSWIQSARPVVDVGVPSNASELARLAEALQGGSSQLIADIWELVAIATRLANAGALEERDAASVEKWGLESQSRVGQAVIALKQELLVRQELRFQFPSTPYGQDEEPSWHYAAALLNRRPSPTLARDSMSQLLEPVEFAEAQTLSRLWAAALPGGVSGQYTRYAAAVERSREANIVETAIAASRDLGPEAGLSLLIPRPGKESQAAGSEHPSFVYSPFEVVAAALLPEEIANLLGGLDEREREILKLRFGLDRGEPRTLEEVGEHFNLSRERIRQIEASAMTKLRHPAGDQAEQELEADQIA